MSLEERVKHQICQEKNCDNHGIFTPDRMKSWYCGDHMDKYYVYNS